MVFKGLATGVLFFASATFSLAQTDSLIRLIDLTVDVEAKITLIIEAGRQAEPKDSLLASAYFYQALRLSKQQENRSLEGEASLALGDFYYSLYLADSVRKYVQAAGDAFTETNNLKGKARTSVLLSNILDDEDKRAESIRVLFEVLQFYEESNDSLEIAKILNRIANSQNYLGYHKDALLHYQRAYGIFSALGHERGQAVVLSNQAIIYGEDGDELTSARYFRKAISIYEAIGNDDHLAGAYNNLGNAYINLKKWDSAHYSISKAITFAEKKKQIHELGFAYSHLTKYFNQRGEPENGIKYGLKGLDIAEKIKNSQLRININQSLSNSYELTGDYKNALAYHKQFQVLEDSVYNIENSEVIHDMQTRYETEKKEKELVLKQADLDRQQVMLAEEGRIRLFLIGGFVVLFIAAGFIYRAERMKAKAFDQLSLKNEEIVTKNSLIQVALTEKEALLKEIHHRVKNNLQVISSILNMQSRASASPEMLSVIQEGQSRVKAMALIHQKLYQTEKLSEIDFREYAEELFDSLSSLFRDTTGKDITRKVVSSDIKLDIDVAIPLGLILNELISNAYKYAFEGRPNGEISVELRRMEDGLLQLEVADNGKGLPLDFDLEKAKSLGLKLVNILTRQLNGQLTFHSASGAHFSILIQDVKSLTA